LHLWLGLIFAPLLVMLALSGIGLNHPQWVQSLSLPLGWMPDNYAYQNWNRGLVEALVADNQGGFYATGKEGVWHLQGETATQLHNPLQSSAWQRMGYSLYLDPHSQQLLNGARDGLYSLDLQSGSWQQVAGSQGQRFVSVVASPLGLFAASRQGLYRLDFLESGYRLTPLAVTLADNGGQSPLFRFIFQLHSGELFGKLGVFIMDATAGLLIFLSLTALYLFLFPRLVKRKWLGREQRIRGGKGFRWMLKHHNQLGLIIALVLLISGLTGMVMRPPGLILISSATSPIKLKDLHSSPLRHIIEKAQWDSASQRLMLLTSGGLYLGQPEAEAVFQPAPLPVPVHAMGATLFEPAGDSFLIGSFSGIYRWQPQTGAINSLALDTGRARMMPKAAVTTADGLAVFDFYTGLNQAAEQRVSLPEMPESVNEKAEISLWHMLFELHNMRIFQAFIGPFYLLLVVLSGLSLVIISISGVYDYFRRGGAKAR